jgi:predicted transposase YdaD
LQLSDKQQDLYPSNKIEKIFPEYYLIKVNNFNDIAKDSLDEWIYFLKNEEIKDNFKAKGLKQAKQELDILKLPEKERQAYERYQDDLHYQASMFESTYTIGHMEGRKEGEKRGEKRGEEKKQIENIINFHKAGVTAELISQGTGLSIDEIMIILNKEN